MNNRPTRTHRLRGALPLLNVLALASGLLPGPAQAQATTGQPGSQSRPNPLPPGVPMLPSGQPDMSKFTRPDADGYRYSPGLTPAQQAQLRGLAAPARNALISTSPLAAINLILNETKSVSGIVLPLDQSYRTALGRAALHVPVNLVTLGAPMQIPRVTEAASGKQRTATPYSVLVTTSNIIFIGTSGVEIYTAPNGTDALKARVNQLQQTLAGLKQTSR